MHARLIPVVVVGAALLAAAQTSAALTPKICTDAAGAHFNFTNQGHHFSGGHYQVMAAKVSCSFADSWTSKLTHATPGKPQPDGGNRLSDGPAGWKCEGKSYTYTQHKPPTISGECYTGSLLNPTKYFHWGIDATRK